MTQPKPPLSPAAQAVLDAANNASSFDPDEIPCDARWIARQVQGSARCMEAGSPWSELWSKTCNLSASSAPMAMPAPLDDAVSIALPLVQSVEGCKLEAYPDPASGGAPWTIGWGETIYYDGGGGQGGRQNQPVPGRRDAGGPFDKNLAPAVARHPALARFEMLPAGCAFVIRLQPWRALVWG